MKITKNKNLFVLKNLLKSLIVEMSKEDIRTSKNPLDWLTAAYEDHNAWKAKDQFEAMEKAAEEAGLKKIGFGTSRAVFDLGDNKVVKVALNEKGIEQNKLEIYAGKDPSVEAILAGTWDYSNDFAWLVSDKVHPLHDNSAAEAESIIGVSWQEVRKIIGVKWSSEFEATSKPESSESYDDEHKKHQTAGSGCLTGQDFLDYLKNFLERYPGMLKQDIAKLSSWGVTADGCLVLLDYGITREKFLKLYK